MKWILDALKSLPALSQGWIHGIFWVVVALYLLGLYALLLHNLIHKKSKIPFEKGVLYFSFLLICATFLLRLMVGLSGQPIAEEQPYYTWEQISSALIHTLQSFSMDENYAAFAAAGKTLSSRLFLSDLPWNPSWKAAFSFVNAWLNINCVFTGGALLLNIISRFFPTVRLALRSMLLRRRPIYYFSELNDASLALAKSLAENPLSRKPILVFSDVYVDSDNERTSEIIQQAKYLGAICLKDDLSALHISRRKGKKFFLMDIDETANLQTLAAFFSVPAKKSARSVIHNRFVSLKQKRAQKKAETKETETRAVPLHTLLDIPTDPDTATAKCIPPLVFSPDYQELSAAEKQDIKKAKDAAKSKVTKCKEKLQSKFNEYVTAHKHAKRDEFYLFYRNDGSTLVIDNIKKFAESEYRFKRRHVEKPLIITVNEYQNLAYSLLMKKPLFTALDRKEENGKLHVTIFGAGKIGTELFLATYWCGQLLNHRLHITVVDKECKDEFLAKINWINPDIFRTEGDFAKIDSPEYKPNEVLRQYRKGSPQIDAVHKEFGDPYFSFDYLQAEIGKAGTAKSLMVEKPDGSQNGPIINSDYFMVALGTDNENLEMAKMVGRSVTKHRGKAEKPIPVAFVVYDDDLNSTIAMGTSSDLYGVEMFPFGSLGETFSGENLELASVRKNAKNISNTYKQTVDKTTRSAYEKMMDDPYGAWANIARAVHIPYKVFCTDLEDSTKEETKGKLFPRKKTVPYPALEQYKDRSGSFRDELNINPNLAWLEHRRWNAFMRAKGFQCPSEKMEKSYYSTMPDGKSNAKKHKSIPLKLHPCLVECDRFKESKPFTQVNPQEYDMLDEVSARIRWKYCHKYFDGMQKPDAKTYNNKETFAIYLKDWHNGGDYKIYDYPHYDF